MADTTLQKRAEEWIVANELPRLYGQPFAKRGVRLAWGGSFEFDAVSVDGRTVVCISTSCCLTASGGLAKGTFQKIRSDALYLLSAQDAGRRVLAFTDEGMIGHFEKERRVGRFPSPNQIELLLVTLPEGLAAELRVAVRTASAEVSPKGQRVGALQRAGQRSQVSRFSLPG